MDADDLVSMNDEANTFAMELLMPAHLVLRDSAGLDICDDRAVERLAKRYRVSACVMAMRIGELRAQRAE